MTTVQVDINTIIRTPRGPDRPYFCHARTTAQDSRLSFEARGLISYLLSKPDDWEISIPDLMREGQIGRDKAYAIIRELKQYRYLKYEQFRKDGQFAEAGYRLYETPLPEKPDTEKPDTDSPLTDLPYTANPQQHSTDSYVSTDSSESDPVEHNTESLAAPDSAAKNGATTQPDSKSEPESEEAIEKPKHRRNKKSPKPPRKAPEDDPWKVVIGFYSFDTPPGKPLKPVEGRINTILGGISAAKFDPLLTVEDLANAYEWDIDMHKEEDSWNAPRGKITVVTMVRGWIKAGRPDYKAGTKYRRTENGLESTDVYRKHMTPYTPTVPVPTEVPKATRDHEGFPINMPEEEKARRRALIQEKREAGQQLRGEL